MEQIAAINITENLIAALFFHFETFHMTKIKLTSPKQL
jgi:hypothetical protein